MEGKKDQKIQKNIDIETGEEIPQNIPPKINNYMNDIKKPVAKTPVEQPEVNPTAPAPTAAPTAAPAPAPTAPPAPATESIKVQKQPKATEPMPKEEMQIPPKPASETLTIGQVKSGVTPTKPGVQKKIVNPAARKKALLGCFGAFAIIITIFLILAFIFIGQSGGETANPVAQLLGLDQALFINGLITLIHGTFIIMALVAFVFTMMSLVKVSTARKDDKVTRKKGLRNGIIGIAGFFIILFIWLFVYVYLDGKRAQSSPEILAPIITEPAETLSLTAPVEIRFDASNVPIDSRKYQIISYEWDFGDGEDGTSQIVSHNFENKGRFDVVLSITKREKSSGEETIDEYAVIVSIENQALTASFDADPQSGEAPLKVTFDASDSVDPDGNIDRYEWDFNDDGVFDDADGEIVKHTFEKIGKYTVALRVVSTTDEFNIVEKEIIVEEQAEPQAIISVVNEPNTYITGTSYIFKADEERSPNGKIVKYHWDFGDGSKSETTKTVSHVFNTEGTLEVVLTLTDEEGEEGEISKTIVVGAPQGVPKAKIETDPVASGVALKGATPFTVSFDGSGSTDSDNNIVDYEWDFDGDGVTDDFGSAVTHTYTSEGNYTVTLTISDADGNKGTASLAVQVEIQGVTAVISATPIEGSAPLTVDFDASGSTFGGGQIVGYEWDFDDGTAPKSGSSKISHKFSAIGSYNVEVTAIGGDGTKDTTTMLITVREIPLAACFSAVFETGVAPLNNTFDPGCTTGTVADYFWDFGDGGTSTGVKPTHSFSDPGEYTVSLEITDAENTVSTTQKIITVTE